MYHINEKLISHKQGFLTFPPLSLQVWFDLNATPSRRQVDTISDHLGLKSAVVWVWFHRQRVRVQQRKEFLAKEKSLNRPAKLKHDVGRSSLSHASKLKATHKIDKSIDMQKQSHRCAEKQSRGKVPVSGPFPKMGGVIERQSTLRSHRDDSAQRVSSHGPAKTNHGQRSACKRPHRSFPVLTTESNAKHQRSHFLLAPKPTKAQTPSSKPDESREKRNISTVDRVVKSKEKEQRKHTLSLAKNNDASETPKPKPKEATAVPVSPRKQGKNFEQTSKAIYLGLRKKTDGKGNIVTDQGRPKRTVQISRTETGKSVQDHSFPNKNPSGDRNSKEVMDTKVHHRAAEKNLRRLKSSNVSPIKGDAVKAITTVRQENPPKCTPLKTTGKTLQTLKHMERSKSKNESSCSRPPPSTNKYTKTASKNEEIGKIGKSSKASCVTPKESIKSSPKKESSKVSGDLQRSIFSSLSFPEKTKSSCNTRQSHSQMSAKQAVNEAASAPISGKSIPVISRPRQPDVSGLHNRKCDRNLRKIKLSSPTKTKKKPQDVNGSDDVQQSSKVTSTVTGDDTSSSEMYCDDLVHSESTDEEQVQPIKVSTSTDSVSNTSSVEKNNLSQGKTDEKENKPQTSPVISKERHWNVFKDKSLFKRELSVNLIKINISSALESKGLLESRKVTMSSKKNPSDTMTSTSNNNGQVVKEENKSNGSLENDLPLSCTPSPERSLWNLVSSLSKKIKDHSVVEHSSDITEKYPLTSKPSMEDLTVTEESNSNSGNELSVCEVSSSGFSEKVEKEESEMVTGFEESNPESKPINRSEGNSGLENDGQPQDRGEKDPTAALHFEEEDVWNSSFLVIDEVVCSDVDTESPQPDCSQETLPYHDPLVIHDAVDDQFDEISDDEDELVCKHKQDDWRNESSTKGSDRAMEVTASGDVENERVKNGQNTEENYVDKSIQEEIESDKIVQSYQSHEIKDTLNDEVEGSSHAQGQIIYSAAKESILQCDAEDSLLQSELPAKESSEPAFQSTGGHTRQETAQEVEEMDIVPLALTNAENRVTEEIPLHLECDVIEEVDVSASENAREHGLTSEQCLKGRDLSDAKLESNGEAHADTNVLVLCDDSVEQTNKSTDRDKVNVECPCCNCR